MIQNLQRQAGGRWRPLCWIYEAAPSALPPLHGGHAADGLQPPLNVPLSAMARRSLMPCASHTLQKPTALTAEPSNTGRAVVAMGVSSDRRPFFKPHAVTGAGYLSE